MRKKGADRPSVIECATTLTITTTTPPSPKTKLSYTKQGSNYESQDVTFEGGPGGSHVNKPVKYAVGVWYVRS